jgi:hypothetical protein
MEALDKYDLNIGVENATSEQAVSFIQGPVRIISKWLQNSSLRMKSSVFKKC